MPGVTACRQVSSYTMFVDMRKMLLLALLLAAAAGSALATLKYEDVKYDFITEKQFRGFNHGGVQWEVHNSEEYDRAYFFNTDTNVSQWEDPRDPETPEVDDAEDSSIDYTQGGASTSSSWAAPAGLETWHVATACAVLVVTALFARSLFLGTPKRSKKVQHTNPTPKAAPTNGAHKATNGTSDKEQEEEEEEPAAAKVTPRRSARARA